jgi:hypothetical protein
LKSRYYPNVQLCVLYPTTKTGPLIAFQTAELSIIEHDIFKFFPTLEPWK